MTKQRRWKGSPPLSDEREGSLVHACILWQPDLLEHEHARG
jgi:hypothetical protein